MIPNLSAGPRTRLCVAIAIGSLAACCVADDRVQRDDLDWDKHADCSGPLKGGTDCLGITGPKAAADIPNLLDTLKWQYGETIPWKKPPNNKRPPEKQWKFKNGGLLKGKWIIEVYYATDYEFSQRGTAYCAHGAHLSCRFERDPSDPEKLDFIQLVKTTKPKSGLAPGTPHIDPYPDTAADDAPFYFTPQDDRKRYRHDSVKSIEGIVFGDTPNLIFEEATPHEGSINFWLTLAAKDPNDPMSVTVYEGISWGLKGQCGIVPEPCSAIVLGVGAAALCRRRKRAPMA